jgi:hypothetical protein
MADGNTTSACAELLMILMAFCDTFSVCGGAAGMAGRSAASDGALVTASL